MKPSELMLKGYAMVGKQCYGRYYEGDGRNPTAVCAVGAMNLAVTGCADDDFYMLREKMVVRWYALFGFGIADTNDEGMAIEDIAGILASEGM